MNCALVIALLGLVGCGYSHTFRGSDPAQQPQQPQQSQSHTQGGALLGVDVSHYQGQAGVAGKVDLNRFNGSAEALRGLLVQSSNR